MRPTASLPLTLRRLRICFIDPDRPALGRGHNVFLGEVVRQYAAGFLAFSTLLRDFWMTGFWAMSF